MQNQFIYTLPRLPQPHLPRPRLTSEIINSSARIKLFCSPAGTGKTILLLECLSALKEPQEVYWVPYTSEYTIENLYSFLALALKTDIKNIDGIQELLLKNTKHINFIIDNYRPSNNSTTNTHLFELMHFSSPTITWWITTRHPLNKNLSQPIINGDVLTISDTDDLAFSTTEINSLFALKGNTLNNEQQLAIQNNTQGWCIAVRAFLFDSKAILSKHWHEHLAQHVEQLLWQELSDEEKNFWLLLAHLEEFNSSLVAYVTESRQQDCLMKIQSLYDRGLFITKAKESGWFKIFPPIAKYISSKSYDQSYSWHLYASQWYASKSKWQHAVEHALRAGKNEEALSMVQKVSDKESFGGDNIVALMQLEKSLSQELLFCTPRLISLIAGTQIFSGQIENAARTLKQFGKFLPQPTYKEQVKILSQWQALWGWCLHLTGNSESANLHLNEAIKHLPSELWEISLTCYSALAQQALLTQKWELAENFLNQALRIARENNSSIIESYLELDYAQILEHKRDIPSAINILKNSCLVLNEEDAIPSPLLGRVQLRLGHLYYRTGDFDKSYNYYTFGLQEAFHWGDHRVLYGYCGLALLDMQNNNLEKASERLREAERVMQKNYIPDALYRNHLEYYLGVLHLYHNQLDEAEHHFKEVYNKYQKTSLRTPLPGTLDLIQECNIYLTIIYLLKNQKILAKLTLEKAYLHSKSTHYSAYISELETLKNLSQYLENNEKKIQDKDFIFNRCKEKSLYGFIKEINILFSPHFDLQNKAHKAELLSQRELEVLQKIANGFASKQIADQMHISLHTVKAHIQRIFKKLNVSRRTQAVAKALELNILQ